MAISSFFVIAVRLLLKKNRKRIMSRSTDFSISTYLNYTVFKKGAFVEDEPKKARPHIVLQVSDNTVWTVQLTSDDDKSETSIGGNDSAATLKYVRSYDKGYYLMNHSLQSIQLSQYHEMKNHLADGSKGKLVEYLFNDSFLQHHYYSGMLMKCSRIPLTIDSNGYRHFIEKVVVVIGAKIQKSFVVFTVCPAYYFQNSTNSIQLKYSETPLSNNDCLYSNHSAVHEMWLDLTQIYTFRTGYTWQNSVNPINVLENFEGEPRLYPSSIELLVNKMKEILLLKIPLQTSGGDWKEESDPNDYSDINTFNGFSVDWNDDEEELTMDDLKISDEEDIPTTLSIESFVEEMKMKEESIFLGISPVFEGNGIV